MNKEHLKATMLALTEAELQQAQHEYAEFLSAARTERTEPIERDELAQARTAADSAGAFDDQVHGYQEKLGQLRKVDFSPKQEVGVGAVVRSGGRHLVIAVSTRAFRCDGIDFIGISTAAPVYQALKGKQAGEHCEFRGMRLTVDEVY